MGLLRRASSWRARCRTNCIPVFAGCSREPFPRSFDRAGRLTRIFQRVGPAYLSPRPTPSTGMARARFTGLGDPPLCASRAHLKAWGARGARLANGLDVLNRSPNWGASGTQAVRRGFNTVGGGRVNVGVPSRELLPAGRKCDPWLDNPLTIRGTCTARTNGNCPGIGERFPSAGVQSRVAV
jgi:hypothetical protein